MSWLIILTIVEWIIRIVMVPVILRRRLPATTALTWLMVVFVVPIVGLALYLVIGDTRLGRRRVKKRRRLAAPVRSGERLTEQKEHQTRPVVDEVLMPMILQAERISGFPIVAGNTVELVADTTATIDSIVADIDKATHHVHLLFYIFAIDKTAVRVCDALVRARERGVCCRLLVDHVGSRDFSRGGALYTQLIDHGVQVQIALPAHLWRMMLSRIDLRNHRKLVVIDGKVAYTGSQNVVDGNHGDKRAGVWHDLMARFTGPVVAQLQMIFIEDWAAETSENLDDDALFPEPPTTGLVPAQTVATGPDSDSGGPDALMRVMLAAINAAQRKIIITTPYFIPDEPMQLALFMAADRGVEVVLVVPDKSDHWLVDFAGRAYYERFLEAGVNIYLHQEGLLHSKTITVDDAFAGIGSSNMDTRSFYLNFELNVLLYGDEVTKKLRFAQQRYISESIALTAEQWHQRSVFRRYLNATASLLSPLL